MGRTKYPALDLWFSPGPGAGALQDFLYAELDDYEPLAIHENEAGNGWRVFFRTPARRDEARAALLSEFRNALLGLAAVDVDDEDWARRTQADLKAVRVGRIIVAPPWDRPPAASDDRAPEGSTAGGLQRSSTGILIVIEPSMGFGTGHHATTRLCLELLQELDVRGRSAIDVGTGSGVLAIAAAKLGARSVLALDNDPDALLSARENVTRNDATSVAVREADIASFDTPPADVVLANLTAAVLQKHAGALTRFVGPGGTLIVSGFAPDELPEVAAAFGGDVRREVRDGEWAAARLGN